MTNILYCGMANDIMSPLLLVPDTKVIYVISLFDEHFSSKGTWASQKEDIKKVLVDGNDKSKQKATIDKQGSIDYYKRDHYLHSDAKLEEEEDNPNNKRWRLKFKYLGDEKELIYYYERDATHEWPEEITNIRHLMFQGSLSADRFGIKKYAIFREMLKERCQPNFLMYGGWWNHKHYGFTIRLSICNGTRNAHDDDRIGVKALKREDVDTFFR
jgi:hypothetical protein